eukprot:2508234-Alexandrium_andersonii.AAC.1
MLPCSRRPTAVSIRRRRVAVALRALQPEQLARRGGMVSHPVRLRASAGIGPAGRGYSEMQLSFLPECHGCAACWAGLRDRCVTSWGGLGW